MINFKGLSTVTLPPGTFNSSVAVNTKNTAFKNTTVLNAAAKALVKQSAGNLKKSVVKKTSTKDSERFSEITNRSSASATNTSNVSTGEEKEQVRSSTTQPPPQTANTRARTNAGATTTSSSQKEEEVLKSSGGTSSEKEGQEEPIRDLQDLLSRTRSGTETKKEDEPQTMVVSRTTQNDAASLFREEKKEEEPRRLELVEATRTLPQRLADREAARTAAAEAAAARTAATDDAQSQEESSEIRVQSFSVPFEQNMFGIDSLFMLPLNPEMSEKSKGMELEKWEKPRVVAIIAEDIRDGYPQTNVVVFKKLVSNRANVLKYTILKKNVFGGSFFYPVAQLKNEQLTVPSEYIDIVRSLEVSEKDSFVFVDDKILPNSTYVYKIEVEWMTNGQQASELATAVPNIIENISSIGATLLGAVDLSSVAAGFGGGTNNNT